MKNILIVDKREGTPWNTFSSCVSYDCDQYDKFVNEKTIILSFNCRAKWCPAKIKDVLMVKSGVKFV